MAFDCRCDDFSLKWSGGISPPLDQAISPVRCSPECLLLEDASQSEIDVYLLLWRSSRRHDKVKQPRPTRGEFPWTCPWLGRTSHRKTAWSSRATHPDRAALNPDSRSSHLRSPFCSPFHSPFDSPSRRSRFYILHSIPRVLPPKLGPKISYPVEPCLGRYDRLSPSFPSSLKFLSRPSPSIIYKNNV